MPRPPGRPSRDAWNTVGTAGAVAGWFLLAFPVLWFSGLAGSRFGGPVAVLGFGVGAVVPWSTSPARVRRPAAFAVLVLAVVAGSATVATAVPTGGHLRAQGQALAPRGWEQTYAGSTGNPTCSMASCPRASVVWEVDQDPEAALEAVSARLADARFHRVAATRTTTVERLRSSTAVFAGQQWVRGRTRVHVEVSWYDGRGPAVEWDGTPAVQDHPTTVSVELTAS